jgi:hypothetical protein
MMRRAIRILIVLVLLGIAAAIASCVAHRPNRTPIDAAPPAPITTSVKELASVEAHRETVGHASVENHGRFRVGIVEFDDQGRFWSRAQYDQVTADLRQVYKDHSGAQVLVFVHGWKHAASVCDANLACFRELLANFAEQEGPEGRPVYGVYVGWRGLSVRAPVVRELTFWSRKEAAHRVGNGDVIELLATLEALHRQEREESPNTRLTTVGHSFGGAVVYTAVSGTLKERLAVHIATPGDRRRLFVGFGTLTVLVNPAFEATRYDGVDRMLAANPGAFDMRNPRVLVTVASEGDRATHYLFPIGRWLSTLFQRSRDREQTSQVLRTVGNYAGFATHRLDEPTPPSNAASPAEESSCLCPTNIRQAFAPPNAAAFKANAVTPPATEEEFFGNTRLTTVADTPQAKSPFIVVRADRGVIADHNDIWSRPFVEFLSSLITRTDALLAPR